MKYLLGLTLLFVSGCQHFEKPKTALAETTDTQFIALFRSYNSKVLACGDDISCMRQAADKYKSTGGREKVSKASDQQLQSYLPLLRMMATAATNDDTLYVFSQNEISATSRAVQIKSRKDPSVTYQPKFTKEAGEWKLD